MRFFFFLPAGSEGEAWELRWPSRFSPQGGKEHALLEGCRVNVCRLMQRTDINKVFLVTFPTAA